VKLKVKTVLEHVDGLVWMDHPIALEALVFGQCCPALIFRKPMPLALLTNDWGGAAGHLASTG
jgi:hypothetical protein